jgi:hypothetical protein
MAQNAALRGNQRYAVVLDIDEETYAMFPYSTMNKDLVLEQEEPIHTGEFTDDFQLEGVIFDYGTSAEDRDTRLWNSEDLDVFHAWLFAGHSGWNRGAKILVYDADGQLYSIVVNRMSRDIIMVKGDADFPEPVSDLRF